ncbi:hypothetical protein LOTGIDRAFT_121668 [Lottia gigantea]|uniref:Calcineurin-like phosphoesterase domain-containing protein n=1 Tax=Lottia gigantea TaxID=225164 RepID=V4AF37_LOTGI|nr:hypothetical protein LOTGIDRAFT_121668 [Lottia gigantea]ESO91941.1 hypothetical protein LOTGIDRAFT_121668 [Lottia gigantea]
MEKVTEITVHPDTDRPTKAWEKIKVQQKQRKIKPMDSTTPISEDKIRFVCISDTHTVLEKTPDYHLPPGDVLIHAGDFSNIGRPNEIQRFNTYLGTLPYKVKIVIAGNHDMTFDAEMVENHRARMFHSFCITTAVLEDKLKEYNISSVKELLKNCIYLEDQELTLCGIKFYGTPWQPEFGGWGFNLKRGRECLDKWNLIPDNTDILISHGPPIGYGDKCFGENRAGCVELLSTIQKRVQPKYLVIYFHQSSYGVTTDGRTTYINASTCTLRYKASNPPIVFDYPIPDGHTKSELLNFRR